MNKKALLKAIAVVVSIIVYVAVLAVALETKNHLLIGVSIGAVVIAGCIAVGIAAYEYFNED